MRQKIEQQLDQLRPDQLTQVSNFLDSIQNKGTTVSQRPLRRLAPIKRGTKAGELLKFAGTWQGNDLEEMGISKQEIVVGFHHPYMREYSDFATA